MLRRIAALCSVLLIMAACSGPATETTSYSLPPTPGGRLCTNQCREAQDYCHQDCTLTHRQCVGKVQMTALQDYEKYTREQYMAHAEIELRISDFERMGPCDNEKKSCMDDCEGHFQSCYQSCGGKVNVTSSCQFLCF